jgi:epoxyqueuosine reductase
MNVARAMGNTRDTGYVKDLIQCFEENSDERVRSMCAWALGRIGGRQSRTALEGFLPGSTGILENEIHYALGLV